LVARGPPLNNVAVVPREHDRAKKGLAYRERAY
jgi:hypothetical protein